MIYKILSCVLSWIFPTKNNRHDFRELCKAADTNTKIKKIQTNYQKVLKNIKNKKGKIRVLFLVNEISKWKAQSLYEILNKNDDFEPFMAITIADFQTKFPKKQKISVLKETFEYFKNKNIRCVYAYDLKKCQPIALKKFAPDIIFYQQPYKLARNQSSVEVSKFALTCYIPYYIPNYNILTSDCGFEFHKYLFRYYVLNDDFKNMYQRFVNEYPERFVTAGHTIIDSIKVAMQKENTHNYVIYAPHWSVCHKNNSQQVENFSTFDKTGKFILEFAKKHPEINWAFKPHPTLKSTLYKIGEMSPEEIENYYADWEKFATCCYDSDYVNLFSQSKALITDCGSFLIEYFCTGKPIIHLISDNCTQSPYRQVWDIYNSFYRINNLKEFEEVIEDLLVRGNDYKKEERQKIADKLEILKANAAQNILEDLLNLRK